MNGSTKDQLAKFHKMTDAKEMWDAIKSRFGGNDESKKMQKFMEQVFENDVKGSTASSSSTQNVAFVSENTSSTNDEDKDAWNSGNKDGSRTGKKEDSKALVTIDGEGVDWTSHSEEDEDYALMACNSSKKIRHREAMKEKEDLKAKNFKPKVWSDAPIIEEYESDSEDEYVSIPTKE
ncbi:hypothetical protein Tco_0914339 [Tanacetum coccineum]